MIQIACPTCQQQYRLDGQFAGKKVKCKACGTPFQIEAPIPTASSDQTGERKPSPNPTPPEEAESIPVAELVTTPASGNPLAMAASPSPLDAGAAPMAKSSAEASQPIRGTTENFRFEISQRPDFSILKIELPQGKKVHAEPSAMVSMTPSVHLEAGFKGGLGSSLGRMLGGESLIINTFTAQDGPGEVMFAGGAAGDIAHKPLNGNSIYLQRGAYMLSSEGVEVSGKWQGAKGFFSGEGLVLLKASGTGDLFFNSYGAILPIDVSGSFIVDTGYIAAFEDTLQYRVTALPGLRAGGKIKSFIFGGEGLVCQFSGSGRVWVQTRQVSSFLSWANPFRPTKQG